MNYSDYIKNEDYNGFKEAVFSDLKERLANNEIIKEYNKRMNYYDHARRTISNIGDYSDFSDTGY